LLSKEGMIMVGKEGRERKKGSKERFYKVVAGRMV